VLECGLGQDQRRPSYGDLGVEGRDGSEGWWSPCDSENGAEVLRLKAALLVGGLRISGKTFLR
jgi:hypothetical protein